MNRNSKWLVWGGLIVHLPSAPNNRFFLTNRLLLISVLWFFYSSFAVFIKESLDWQAVLEAESGLSAQVPWLSHTYIPLKCWCVFRGRQQQPHRPGASWEMRMRNLRGNGEALWPLAVPKSLPVSGTYLTLCKSTKTNQQSELLRNTVQWALDQRLHLPRTPCILRTEPMPSIEGMIKKYSEY